MADIIDDLYPIGKGWSDGEQSRHERAWAIRFTSSGAQKTYWLSGRIFFADENDQIKKGGKERHKE